MSKTLAVTVLAAAFTAGAYASHRNGNSAVASPYVPYGTLAGPIPEQPAPRLSARRVNGLAGVASGYAGRTSVRWPSSVYTAYYGATAALGAVGGPLDVEFAAYRPLVGCDAKRFLQASRLIVIEALKSPGWQVINVNGGCPRVDTDGHNQYENTWFTLQFERADLVKPVDLRRADWIRLACAIGGFETVLEQDNVCHAGQSRPLGAGLREDPPRKEHPPHGGVKRGALEGNLSPSCT
ncbi:hypothetical protein FBZ94_104636 [Bradyrhizobium sacchari]|uniref:Uncharacterized protein n=1 Tax=Bradyrhizobium sacchari TaxID=1399419 RepID=A0A560IPQ5_9BRAD|nr:hypothetical protein FBZ94_104636 [Bradyrhizobium sacchari]TWB73779.1 hypothetical protein FBZ95_10529 [Bradyrhizobium sacchari]